MKIDYTLVFVVPALFGAVAWLSVRLQKHRKAAPGVSWQTPSDFLALEGAIGVENKSPADMLQVIEAITWCEVKGSRRSTEAIAELSFAAAIFTAVFGFCFLVNIVKDAFGAGGTDYDKVLVGTLAAVIGAVSSYIATTLLKTYELSLTSYDSCTKRAELMMTMLIARRICGELDPTKRDEALLKVLDGLISTAPKCST